MKSNPHLLGFQTKVLIPVISVMVLLLVTTDCIVNCRITRRIERRANERLLASAVAIESMVQVHEDQLIEICSDEANRPNLRSGIHNPAADSLVREFSKGAQCQIALVADTRVIGSTLPAGSDAELVEVFQAFLGRQLHAEARRFEPAFDVSMGGQTYLCLAGRWPLRSTDGRMGFLLIASREPVLQELAEARKMLLLASLVCMLISTLIVQAIIRRITSPLRALRDGAEAIGHGDFSRHIPVTSWDECGELAAAFNSMTDKIQASREEHEKTVETLRAMQQQLVQREKLSAIGEFVAGVAHELNNPLTSVMGFAQLLQKTAFEPQDQRFLDRIIGEAQRCARIVKSLLSFARQHPPERKLININDCVSGSLEILHYQLRTSGIEVATRFDPDLPRVLGDSHQLQQVFVNIINNGRQAIEIFRPNGCIKIATSSAGSRVTVSIQDNGPGISQENITKIFDPFFTTKELGKGTGLGLSLSYGIIEHHGGDINVRSKLGEGAIFTINLPAALEVDPGRIPANTPDGDEASASSGLGRRLLIVDDEDAILEFARELLVADHYHVDTARDGQTALRKASLSRYDLIVCDMKMPGLSGQQVYERLRATNPKSADRLIFMTGDVVGGRTQEFFQHQGIVCLPKPFTRQDLRSTIERLFQSGGTATAQPTLA